MTQLTKDAWTRAHDLALIFIALAYGTDQDLSDDELATITEMLQHWRDEFPVDEVQEVVLEAVAIYLEKDAGLEVLQSMHALKEQLSPEDRRRALEDVVRIAEADGVLLSTEQSLISRLASIWELKAAGQRLIDQTTVTVESEPEWSLLHDVALLYVVLAHSSNNELSEPEIAAMVERLGDWQPELSREEIRGILREALSFYAGGPDREALQHSVEVIRDFLPVAQRLVLLDDLVHIARVDGEPNEHEKRMLNSLARAWAIGIRMDEETKK